MRVSAALALSFSLAVSGCSIKTMAVNTVANTLSEVGTTFTSDEDVKLVGDAIPFALKFYESILESTPKHQALLLATCSSFTQYAYAYVETDAEALPPSRSAEIQALRDRALKLYLRARGYCFRAVNVRFGEGSSDALLQKPESVMAKATRKDVPLLYWTAASWGAAISLGLDRPEIAVDLPIVRVLADRALALDDTWEQRDVARTVYYARRPARGPWRKRRAAPGSTSTERSSCRRGWRRGRTSHWRRESRWPARTVPNSSGC